MGVDTTFGKCYAMDSRSVPVVGVMKDVEFKLVACPEASYKIDITVVDVPPNYGMLLSRQWSNMIGGHAQLDLSYTTIPVNGHEVRIEREPCSLYIIEDLEMPQLIYFIQSDMDNFKVQLTKAKNEDLSPIQSCIKETNDQAWSMYFDGSCSKEESGVGILFISPSREMFKYSFKLLFECTNNIAEYEALITRLNLAAKHGIKILSVFGDSELIVSQVKGKYASKHIRLKQYRNAVWDTIEIFSFF